MVDLKNQYIGIKSEVDAEIAKVLDRCDFINGGIVRVFAQNLGAYLGTEHVIPCANGTDALMVALMSLGLKPGDEIITTPFTFVATAEVIALLGLEVKFVDIDPNTFLMREDQLKPLIGEKTKCILPVHIFGQCSNMQRILQIAKESNLFVLEDNAQSIGSMVKIGNHTQKSAGAIGDLGTTSFFPSKNLGCFGDGGAIFSNNDALAEKAKTICNHGSKVKYHNELVGVNSRLDSLQAAVLNVKLKYLDLYIQKRQKAAHIYDELLDNIDGVQVPKRVDHSSHVFHQYTLRIPSKRDKVHQELTKKGIPSAIYYPIPLHLQEAYHYLGHEIGDFPNSELVCEQVLSLPMHTELDFDTQKYIVDNIKLATF